MTDGSRPSDRANDEPSAAEPPVVISPIAPLVDLILFVWGISSLVAAGLTPGLIETLPVVGAVPGTVSALSLLVGGSLVLASGALRSSGLYLLLAVGAIIGMVGSWTGTIHWAVPYEQGLASLSMAAMHLLLAVLFAYNSMQYSGFFELLAGGQPPDQ